MENRPSIGKSQMLSFGAREFPMGGCPLVLKYFTIDAIKRQTL